MMADLESKADRYRDDPSVRVALTKKGVEVQGGFKPVTPRLACWERYCDELIAGTGHFSSFRRCSLNFLTGAGGAFMYLTAGHCIYPGGTTQYSCKPWITACVANPGPSTGTYFGDESGQYYGGNDGDNGTITITAPQSWGYWSGWWHWGNSARVAIYGSDAPVNEETVCQGGRITGIACGITHAASTPITIQDPFYGDVWVNGMAWVRNICINSGDSGGPVTRWDGTWAKGIVSAGSGCGDLYYDPISRALSNYGLQLFGGG